MSLALIAGRGQLAALVAEVQDVVPLICAYEGYSPERLTPDLTFRLETLGSLLVDLGGRGITDVCFAGGLERPDLDPTKLDAETAPLVPLFEQALKMGDDGALKIIIDLFEKTGFSVRAAHDLAPHLLAEGGVYADLWPDAQMRADADIGALHIAEMGAKDIGQACIISKGRVMGMEDANGTDALIARLRPFPEGTAAILFKGPKPDQSRLVDLPTIGPDTIEAAGSAGLAGVVIDAGDVLVIDKPRCIELANQHGLVLWARTGA